MTQSLFACDKLPISISFHRCRLFVAAFAELSEMKFHHCVWLLGFPEHSVAFIIRWLIQTRLVTNSRGCVEFRTSSDSGVSIADHSPVEANTNIGDKIKFKIKLKAR